MNPTDRWRTHNRSKYPWSAARRRIFWRLLLAGWDCHIKNPQNGNITVLRIWTTENRLPVASTSMDRLHQIERSKYDHSPRYGANSGVKDLQWAHSLIQRCNHRNTHSEMKRSLKRHSPKATTSSKCILGHTVCQPCVRDSRIGFHHSTSENSITLSGG